MERHPMFTDEKNIVEMAILPKLNANKSHHEMLPLTQGCYYKEGRGTALARMWRNQNLSKLLVGTQRYSRDGKPLSSSPTSYTDDPATPARGPEKGTVDAHR